MGISILEMINELRNGRIRHKINQILERIRHLRLQQQETTVPPQRQPEQQGIQQPPIRRSRRVRKQVDRLNLKNKIHSIISVIIEIFLNIPATHCLHTKSIHISTIGPRTVFHNHFCDHFKTV